MGKGGGLWSPGGGVLPSAVTDMSLTPLRLRLLSSELIKSSFLLCI